jgi:hypothetical protein
LDGCADALTDAWTDGCEHVHEYWPYADSANMNSEYWFKNGCACACARARAGGLCTCSPRDGAQLPATLIPPPPPPPPSPPPPPTQTPPASAARAAPDAGGHRNPITAAGGLSVAGTTSVAGPGSGGSVNGSGGLGAAGPGSGGSCAGAVGRWLKKMVSTDTCDGGGRPRRRAGVFVRARGISEKGRVLVCVCALQMCARACAGGCLCTRVRSGSRRGGWQALHPS